MNQGAISNIVQQRYLLYENCENGQNQWFNDTGSINFTYRNGNELEGHLAFYITASGGMTKRFAGSASLASASLHFRVRVPSLASATDIAGFCLGTTNSGTNFNGFANVQTNGTVRIYENGASSFTATSATMTANTAYHVWIERRQNLNSKLWFSTSSIRPASGSANFAQVNVGSSNLNSMVWFGYGQAIAIDDIQVEAIGAT